LGCREAFENEGVVMCDRTGADDRFGGSVALASDTLAVGAEREDSAAIVVGGNQADNSVANSGAVYVYRAQ
jgi:trimeric autotransporter adhesin